MTNQGSPLVDWYERHLLPPLIDLACGMSCMRRQRIRIVPLAGGQVLEVGIGTGRNLEHYDRARIERIVGLDPGLAMQPLARRRGARLNLPVELFGESAEQMPFAAASFDSIVITYSLCTIADPLAALAEMRRVLKPEGRVFFCEHGLAPDEGVRRWQRRITPTWSKLAGGCRLDRDIPQLFAEAGFATTVESAYLSGPRVVGFNYWGTARRT